LDALTDLSLGLSASSSNPLDVLTAAQLWNLEILLDLSCNRQRGVLRNYRRQHLCLAGQTIKAETDLRALPHPPTPHYYGDLKPHAL
jgi:hypothetical protein